MQSYHNFKLEKNDLGPIWQMEDLEKTQRLKEILAKLDPRAETPVREGGLFKSAELLRRKLVYEGTLLWKTPGSRYKGTGHYMMMILMLTEHGDGVGIFLKGTSALL